MQTEKTFFSKTLNVLLLLSPFLVAAGAYYCIFYPGEIVLSFDAPEYFFYYKYYLDNLGRGVYPLWNPFYLWGYPDNLFVRSIGDVNPFLLWPLVLNQVGLKFSLAYFVYLLSYFFFGVWGFYLLARRVLQDDVFAWTAAGLVLFSSMGISFFYDNAIILLFVPTAWFFYFLFRFAAVPDRIGWWGLITSLMIVAVTYMPFYFLTVTGVAVFFMALFFPWRCVAALRRWLRFTAQNRVHVVLGGVLLLAACVPGWLWYQEAGGSEYVVGWRHEGADTEHMAGVSLTAINAGGIVGEVSWQDSFSRLRDVQLNTAFFPAAAFLFFLGGLMGRVNRRLVVMTGLAVTVTLIAMTSVTPLHKWLYDHVFFMRYFRNVQYLFWLVVPVYALMVAEMLRQVCRNVPDSPAGRLALSLWIIGVHGAAAVWLLTQAVNVIPSLWVTLLASGVFFLAVIARVLRPHQRGFCLFLILLIGLHPAEVMAHLKKNVQGLTISYTEKGFRPVFRFLRPKKEFRELENDWRQGRIPEVRDRSGLMVPIDGEMKYIGVRRSFLLHQSIPHEKLEPYVRHKFFLYDRVIPWDEGQPWPFEEWAQSLPEHRNAAYLASVPADETKGFQSSPSVKARILDERAPDFKVTYFDLNEIHFQTRFPEKKILVYNDSFHSRWRAWCNGSRAPLFPANGAFKALILPPGVNDVVLKFGRPGEEIFFKGLMAVLTGLFSVLGIAGFRGLRQEGWRCVFDGGQFER